MARKIGSYDKRKRKARSDIGKHRKKYAGKPVRRKKRKIFAIKKGHKEYIKIWAWERVPMSRNGYLRWNRKARIHAFKKITIFRNIHLVHINEIDTREKIEKFIAEHYWAGEFVIMGISNAKTKTHRKWVKICRISVRETDKCNVGKMINNYRLSRYWFWKG